MNKLIFLILFLFSHVSLANLNLPKGISWKTNVESAMANAKKQNRPLFLYWGAVWCPPCNQIKKVIFSSKLFQTEIKNFIAVYLDGDQESSQRWGAYFKTSGYPTMIVLNPLGKELMRLPTGINVDDTVRYMKLATSHSDQSLTIKELIQLALDKKLKPELFAILAFHSWSQDDFSLDAKDRADVFYKLYELTPPEFEVYRSRFYTLYLQNFNFDKKAELKVVKDFLVKILSMEELILKNSEYFAYDQNLPQVFTTFFPDEKERQNQAQKYIETLKNLLKLKKLSLLDQLLVSRSLLVFQTQMNLKPREESLVAIKDLEKLIFKRKLNNYEGHALLSHLVDLYAELKFYAEAKRIAKKSLKLSHSPYYFYADLAYLAHQELKEEERLEFSKNAWFFSKGLSTRMRFGSMYLSTLLEVHPQHEKDILKAVHDVFWDVRSSPDLFFSSSLARLNRFKDKFKKWEPENKLTAIKVKSLLKDFCDQSSAKSQCLEWYSQF